MPARRAPGGPANGGRRPGRRGRPAARARASPTGVLGGRHPTTSRMLSSTTPHSVSRSLVADGERRHQDDDVPERSHPHPATAGSLADGESGAIRHRLDLDAGHGADATDLAHAVVPLDALEQLAHPLAHAARRGHRAAFGHQGEVGERGGAAQRVGGVGVPVEERAGVATVRRGTPRRPTRGRAPPRAAGSRRSGPCRRSSGRA